MRVDNIEVNGRIRNHRIAGDRAAFVGIASDIWHTAYRNLVDVEAGKRLMGEDIIELAGANFNVYKVPMFIQAKDGTFAKTQYGTTIARDAFPDYVGDGTRGGDARAVHEDPNVPVQLGMVRGGPRAKYVIRQNIETAQMFDEFVEAGLMSYTGAAVLERGVAFFVAAKVAEGIVRTNPDGSDDVLEGFGTLYNRHDGCSSTIANWSGTRVVCNNTLLQALATGINARIQHSGKMHMKLDEAKREMAKGSEVFNGLLAQLRAMNAVKATKTRVDRLFEVVFPVTKEEAGEDGQGSTRRKNKVETIKSLMEGGIGNGGGTIYDWFNGVTQFLDHSENGSGPVTEDVFVSSNFGNRGAVRARAFEAAMSMAS